MRHFITLRLDNGFCIIYNAASVAISPTRLGASPRRAVYAFYDDCLRDTARYCAVRISSARSDWPALSPELNVAGAVARPTHHSPFSERRTVEYRRAKQHWHRRSAVKRNTIRYAVFSASPKTVRQTDESAPSINERRKKSKKAKTISTKNHRICQSGGWRKVWK